MSWRVYHIWLPLLVLGWGLMLCYTLAPRILELTDRESVFLFTNSMLFMFVGGMGTGFEISQNKDES